MELKPALTYQQQIDYLKAHHNLTINDEIKASQILERVNYYRLSAYGIGLKKADTPEEYVDGTTLETLFSLYQFDSSFRNLFIHLIEGLEVQLRTRIAYQLAIKYGPEGYMRREHFASRQKKDGTDVYAGIIQHFQQECERQKSVPFVKHHMSKYEGHFPIWVAIELFTFGNVSSLYDVMLPEDQKAIASLYGTDSKYLKSWILSLVEVRNICAHYTRLYNLPLKQAPHLYRENRKYRNPKVNKIFPVLLVAKRMSGSDSEAWYLFMADLIKLFDRYQDVIQLSFIGFPNDWKTVLYQQFP